MRSRVPVTRAAWAVVGVVAVCGLTGCNRAGSTTPVSGATATVAVPQGPAGSVADSGASAPAGPSAAQPVQGAPVDPGTGQEVGSGALPVATAPPLGVGEETAPPSGGELAELDTSGVDDAVGAADEILSSIDADPDK